MNSNSLVASLVDGYGHQISADMLDALGIDFDDDFETPRAPAKLTFKARHAHIDRAANSNLRLAG